MLSKALQWVTLLFAVANVGSGVPIVVGAMLPRQFVPGIMSHFDPCANGDAERLYNIVFGLLAVLLGLARVVAVCNWSSPGMLCLLAVTFAVEATRDSVMMSEGYIGMDEAVALVPSALLLLCSLAVIAMGSAKPKSD